VVEQVGGNFTEGGLSRLDTGAAGVRSKGAGHASWVVRGKGLFVDRFEDGDAAIAVLDDVGTACTIGSERGLNFLVESFLALGEASFNAGIGSHGGEEFDLSVSRY